MQASCWRCRRRARPVAIGALFILEVEARLQVEDLRDQMMLKGIPVHYPASEERAFMIESSTEIIYNVGTYLPS